MTAILGVDVTDVRLPTAAPATVPTRSTGVTTRPPTSSCTPTPACRRRADVHERSWQRDHLRGGTRARPPRRGAQRGGDRGGSGRVLAFDHRRPATALAGPGEGGHPHGRRCAGERGVGSARPAGRQADVALPRRDARARADRFRGLPAHHRRADPGRGARAAGGGGRRVRRPPGAAGEGRLPRVHHLRRLAGLPRREGPSSLPGARRGRLARGQDEGGRPTRRRRPAGPASSGSEIGPDAQAHDRREPALGRGRGDRRDGPGSAPFDLCWIEEPTSPDDVLGHARDPPRRRADRGGDGRGRPIAVVFKQLLQAGAIGFCQIDALPARRAERGARGPADGGEVRHPGVPARRRRGFGEYVQHLALFDYLAARRRARRSA